MSKRESQFAKCDHRPPDKYETLDDLFAQAKHYSEWSLREKGSVWPALFILSQDDRPAFFAWTQDFGDERSKDAFHDLCRCFCMAHAATAAVLALETWVSCHNLKPGAKRELTEVYLHANCHAHTGVDVCYMALVRALICIERKYQFQMMLDSKIHCIRANVRLGRLSECSQIRITFHPFLRSFAVTFLSRLRFPAYFRRQNPIFEAGRR